MTSKNTKRALVVSVLSVVLCFAMLAGSTFAWFTDTAVVSGNKISSGTLEIELWKTSYNDWMDQPGEEGFFEENITDSQDPIFSEDILWEPGYLAYTNIEVKNVGSLAAKIKAILVAQGEIGALADVIDVYVANVPLADYYDSYTVRQFFNGEWVLPWGGGMNMFDSYVKHVGSLADVIENGIALVDGEEIFGDDSHTLAIALKMREDAGNEYQGATAGAFDIRVDATQATEEADSFDDQYDANAKYAWDGAADDDALAAGTDDDAKTVAISTPGALLAFANAVNGGNDYNDYTITLEDDIDLENVDWEPIGQTGATQFYGVFDGNGYTISNLYVDSEAETGDYYSSGLFGWLEQSAPAIKNLTIDGAYVKGHHNVAVIAGYAYGTIENCTVKNATVSCTYANSEANGDKCGAIAGYIGEDATVKNCSAENVAIDAGRDAGQLVGAAKAACVVGGSATNVTVVANGTSTGANINEALIGRVLG